jgi:hypothetical protein
MDERIRLMYEQSISAPAIAFELGVTLSTVYRSLKRQSIVRRTATEQNRIRFENKSSSYNFRKILTEKEKHLVIAALMLYYGEGAKTQRTVDFANSEPNAVALFLRFLREICRVDKNRLRFYLYCFEGQEPKSLMRFWVRKLKVNPKHFTKPYIRKNRFGIGRIMPYGVLHIRYSDKKLLQHILNLIDQIAIELS